ARHRHADDRPVPGAVERAPAGTPLRAPRRVPDVRGQGARDGLHARRRRRDGPVLVPRRPAGARRRRGLIEAAPPTRRAASVARPMSPFAALQTHPWAFPALEAVHIAGIAVLLGNLVLFEVRFLGLGSAIALRPLARLALPLAVAGFVLA